MADVTTLSEKFVKSITPEIKEPKIAAKSDRLKRRIYDIIFIIGFLCCVPVGAFPQTTAICSIALLICIVACFFDDNFYLFAAIFMFMRYRMMMAGLTPTYRVYSYLVVLKFLLELPKLKFRLAHLPALFVFAIHCIFAFGRIEGSFRLAMNTLVDTLIIYIILLKVLSDANLTRRFFVAFLMGGILSGIYGWTNSDVTKHINIRGAGATKVARNFGALGDANFAGYLYTACFCTALMVKTIPLLIRYGLAALFAVMLLQTASLSGIIMLVALICIMIILKYRAKAFFILLFAVTAIGAVIAFLLTIPQFREIPAISGLMIRISEKLTYISMGNMDQLTTGRSTLWQEALEVYANKDLIGQLIGGSVVTVMHIDTSLISIAIHQSFIQGLLNFGVLGTLMIYLPFVGVIIFRLARHFSQKAGYPNEDIGILRLVFPLSFLLFGLSVDFFIDWTYLFFYFI